MIHWVWVLIAFFFGALFGVFLTAIIQTNRNDDD